MINFLRSAFHFVLFSNIFMSLCAVAQAMVTLSLIGCKPIYPVLCLLFLSTFCLYNFCAFMFDKAIQKTLPYKSIHWFFEHQKLMVVLTVFAGLAIVPLILALSLKSQLLLIVLSVVSVCYSLPIFSKNGQKFGFRNIPGLKSVLIATVWAGSCVLLPIFEAESRHWASLTLNDAIILTAKRLMFIAALTIPFDIRDLFHDSLAGLKTIPVMLGEKKAYLLCLGLLAAYLILLLMFRNRGFNTDFWPLAATTVLAGWLIFKSGIEKNEYYYFFYIDGILILQYLLLVAFRLI